MEQAAARAHILPISIRAAVVHRLLHFFERLLVSFQIKYSGYRAHFHHIPFHLPFYAAAGCFGTHDFVFAGNTVKGDKNMKTNKQLLSSILKTTQIGQSGIRSVLDTSMRPALRKALQSQLQEYDSIESQAHAIATQRGWELAQLQPGTRAVADLVTRMKLSHGNADSKIADMMIQGNTRGMIEGLKSIHQYSTSDSQISALSQRLLDCETANIRQMQNFL